MNDNIHPILRHGGLLALFAIVATGLISAVFALTKPKIDAQIEAQKKSILGEVVPDRHYDNPLHLNCVELTNEIGIGQIYRGILGGKPSAYAIETTASDGYSGDIDMLVGVNSSLEVLGVRVLKHKETPGLGDKVELSVSDWILSFNNLQYNEQNATTWRVKKDGGRFDQFTGATITPRAVVGQVATTLEWLANNLTAVESSTAYCHSIEQLETE